MIMIILEITIMTWHDCEDRDDDPYNDYSVMEVLLQSVSLCIKHLSLSCRILSNYYYPLEYCPAKYCPAKYCPAKDYSAKHYPTNTIPLPQNTIPPNTIPQNIILQNVVPQNS